jgi:hypothetical protein
MRYLVGACEVAGGIGLLIPKVSALAAILVLRRHELPLKRSR